MPNPGSPQSSMPQTQQAMSAMPKGTMIGMFATLIIMMVVMMFREPIGEALNFVFQFIDFNGDWPVLTLVIAGLIMITLSTVVRSLMTDFVGQARTQSIQSEFNKEMRQARLDNNLYKLKKLQDEQPKMMSSTMENSTKMMKTMPVTMVIIIPIYAWVWFFLENTAGGGTGEVLINLPWGSGYNVLESLWFIPSWIVVYTMISLPIGQLETRIVKYLLLRKRLKELDGIEYKS